MRHEIVEVIDDKKQKESEERIRQMRSEFTGIPFGDVIGVLGTYPNKYRHRNTCNTCGFAIEYISHTRQMDPRHTCPRCEYYSTGAGQ